MEVLKTGWLFFQEQVLGMKWLNVLVGNGLDAIGLSTEGKTGGILQFFIYDTIKIFVLLSVLIFMISYIQSFFRRSGVGKYWEGFTEYGQMCSGRCSGQ